MSANVLKPNKTLLRVILAATAVLILCGALSGGAAAASLDISNALYLQVILGTDCADLDESSSTVTLKQDVTLTYELIIKGTMTLDLNGCVIRALPGTRAFTVDSNGNFTVTDTSSDKYHYYTVLEDKRGYFPWQESKEPSGLWVLNDSKTTDAKDFSDSITYDDLKKNTVIKVKGGCITGGKGNGDDSEIYGGGVYVDGGTFTLSGGNIIGNSVWRNEDSSDEKRYLGGGVYVSGGEFKIEDGIIAGNSAYSTGGGVYVDGGTFTLSGGNITGNNADGGAGVFVEGGNDDGNSYHSEFTMSGGTIGANRGRGGGGGGVSISEDATFTMTSGNIIGNTVCEWNSAGGGVYVDGGTFTMSNGTISKNTAPGEEYPIETVGGGGGVALRDGSTFTMSGSSQIIENESRYYGGGVLLDGRDNNFTMSGESRIIKNKSYSCYGGGVALNGNNNTFTMSDNSGISYNIAGEGGGGIYISKEEGGKDGNSVVMTSGFITNNESLGEGAGVFVGNHSSLTVRGGTISGNLINYSHNGGGVYLDEHAWFYVGEGTDDVVIKDNANTDDENKVPNNVYMKNSYTFYLTGPLTRNSEIQITNPSEGEFGRTLNNYIPTTEDLDCIKIDDSQPNLASIGAIYEKGSLQRVALSFNPGYTVTFDWKHEGKPADQRIVSGGLIVPPAENPLDPAHPFDLWCRDAARTIAWNFKTDTVTANTTLYGREKTDQNYPLIEYNNQTFYSSDITSNPDSPFRGGKASYDFQTNTLTLNEDIQLDYPLYILPYTASSDTVSESTRDFVIDLNGHVLELIKQFGLSVVTVQTGAELTVKDSDTTVTYYFKYSEDRYILDRGATSGDFSVSGGCITGGHTLNTSCGGGVHVEKGGIFALDGGNIAGNSSTSDGGGVYVEDGGKLSLRGGSSIVYNTAEGNGGGVYYNGNGKSSLFIMSSGSTISSNKSGKDGGGVYNTGDMYMQGGTISRNEAAGNGGGIYNANPGYVSIDTNSTVSGNRAVNGGGVYNTSASSSISNDPQKLKLNGTLSNNEASENGGGVYNTGDFTTTYNGTISGNSAKDGGGVYNSGTFQPGYRHRISGNTASGNGGGVYNAGTGTFTVDVTEGGFVSSNSASGNGGGVYTAGVFTMSSGTIESNAAVGTDVAETGSGGGVFVASGGSFELIGGQITGNRVWHRSNSGGGVFVYTDGTFTMSSGTIAKNYSPGYGGGVFVYTGGTFTLSDGVIGGSANDANTAAYGAGIYAENATFTMAGGQITHNSAYVIGGGVIIYNSDSATNHVFTMSGGVINNNSISGATSKPGQGVAIGCTDEARSQTIFKMSGTASIPASNDLYLSNGTIITIPAAFASGESYGAKNIILNEEGLDRVLVASAASEDIASSALPHLNLNESHGKYVLKIDSSDPTRIIASDPDKVTVTFVSNGGSAVASQTLAKGDKAKKPTPEPTKSGSVFKGWFTDDGTFANEYNFDTPVTSDLTLYAKWEERYQVTYDGNGQTAGFAPIDGKTYVSGNFATILDAGDLRKSNYHFDSWNTKADGTGDVYHPNDQITVTGNLNLFAQWKENQLRVTYDGNGAESGTAPSDSNKYNINDSVTVLGPGDLKKAGSFFNGWTVSGDPMIYDEGSTYQIKTNSDVTFVAIWEETEKYSLSYNANEATSGTVPKTEEHAEGESVTIAENSGSLKRIGYAFKTDAGGKVLWSTSKGADGTEYAAGSTIPMPQNNLVLYAQWSANTYKITYHSNFSSPELTQEQSRAYDDKERLFSADTFTREGYTFSGWNMHKDGSGRSYPAEYAGNLTSEPGATIDLYAQWTAGGHQITFYSNGGIFDKTAGSTEKTITCTIGQPFRNYFQTLNVSREGYIIDGWYTESEGGTEIKDSDIISDSSPSQLYAHWKPITYTIEFASGGGSGTMGPITLKYDEEQTLPKNEFKKDGYTFSGWSTPGSLKLIEDKATVKNLTKKDGDTVVLTAVWTAKPYTVTFYRDTSGSEIYLTAQVPAGSLISRPSDPERPGYAFAGWFKKDGTSWDFSTDTMPQSALSLYADWTELRKYTVTYNANGGTGDVPAPQQYLKGTQVTVQGKGNLKRDDAVFSGWNDRPDGTGVDYPAGSVFTIEKDIVLYADWTPRYMYSITIHTDGEGTVTANPPYASEGTLIQLTSTPDSGYRLADLRIDPDTVPIDMDTLTFIMPGRNVSLYADFEPSPTPTPTPVPSHKSSSQESSVWITATPTPTPTPTVTPTEVSTPGVPTVKPVTTQTPQAKTPAPFAGILAGLGAAGILFGLRRK